MKSVLTFRNLATLVVALSAWTAVAQMPADVLVRSPEATITRADWDAELTRIPAEQRVPFATSPQRVQSTLSSMLVNKTLAARARTLGLDKDPVVERRLALEVDRTLTALMIEKIETDAGAEFDRATEKNLARARELYLVNRAKYLIAEEVDVSHLLYDTTKRGKEPALAAATDARAKLLAGRRPRRARGERPTTLRPRAIRAVSVLIRAENSIPRSRRRRSRSRTPATSASPC